MYKKIFIILVIVLSCVNVMAGDYDTTKKMCMSVVEFYVAGNSDCADGKLFGESIAKMLNTKGKDIATNIAKQISLAAYTDGFRGCHNFGKGYSYNNKYITAYFNTCMRLFLKKGVSK